jgi:mannose-6-phosphate isomerase-like protein (cupin superfamily)
MDDVKNFIESGILESFVMGITNKEETELVQRMAIISHEVRDEINSISDALELYASSKEVAPDPTIKPFLLATIDYKERLKAGEQPAFPPVLNNSSRITDFNAWLERKDMALPNNFTDFHAKIIGYTPAAITAIVWIKEMAPQEVHDDEYEKFLIVEGTCDITIDGEVHHLVPGDYLSIPLHKAHHVTVTSIVPCKVILQRLAA